LFLIRLAAISRIANDELVWYFHQLFIFGGKEGTVGTTKLTRKEMLSEDPVHIAIVQTIEFFRTNGAKVAAGAVAIALLACAGYFGLQYLDRREAQAQEQLGKGMDFFHGAIAADATNDPYGKGPAPTFRSESDKYQAAAKEFSPIAAGHGYGEVSAIARYYLGLSQLRLGQKKEAIQNLETVASDSKNRTLGFLAKRALAANALSAGEYKKAQQFLEGMIKDPQCDLQKEDLSIQLSRALVAEGKRDEAVKALVDANAQSSEFGIYKQQLITEMERLQKGSKAGVEPKSAHP
jgi:predicted negative regulator of RcsB-dependent stress response